LFVLIRQRLSGKFETYVFFVADKSVSFVELEDDAEWRGSQRLQSKLLVQYFAQFLPRISEVGGGWRDDTDNLACIDRLKA